MSSTEEQTWTFTRFGLLVTGQGEERFAANLFRPLLATGRCSVEMIARIGQRSPITSPRRKLEMQRGGKRILDKDEREIGVRARLWLQKQPGPAYVILLDDVEHERCSIVPAVFSRYRQVLDSLLGPSASRAGVFFLRNMIEAYYFADASATNPVLHTQLTDYSGDVETIRHPKSTLKELSGGFFDEIKHGESISAALDIAHVLSRPDTCASLRTLYAWCIRALGLPAGPDFCLAEGVLDPVTKDQRPGP